MSTRDARRRLKILALSYLFPNRAEPGYGVFVLNRLRAVQQFCDVRVIAPVQWYPFIDRLRGWVARSGIPAREEIGGLDVLHPRFGVIPRYMKWLDGLSYFLAILPHVKRLRETERFEFDIVDVHWTYPDIVAGYLIARKYGKKMIVTVRGHEALYEEEISLRRWLVRWCLRRADAVVALSRQLRDRVVELGVNPEKVRIILNGVDLSRFRALDRVESRRALGLPTDRKIIVSVGRITKGKGHQDLVRMLPELLKTEDVSLYIIGGVNPEDDFGKQLGLLIEQLGLEDVHLVDKVTQDVLPLWYSAADLFCLASVREGCPNVVLEALACGTPVAVTDVGAARDLVQSGINGELVNRAPRELADTVRRMLNRKWDRELIADGMQAKGWSGCARQVVHLYDFVLGRQGEPAASANPVSP